MKFFLSLGFVIFCSPLAAQTNGMNASVESSFDEDIKEFSEKTDDFGSLSIGHNLSTNNRTLKSGQWTLGTLYVGHGITDNWSMGTSIFVWNSFEMANLMTRYAFNISKKERLGFDAAYFKTYGGKALKQNYCVRNSPNTMDCSRSYTIYDGFIMEAANLKVTYNNQLRPYYRFNTTASYYYYWDDRMPFSFRMDPANSDPYTINLSSLHEFRLYDNMYINYELGLWGFNYQYPYIHTGLTVNFQIDDWMWGIGGSTTFSPSFPVEQARDFAGYDSRASYHPEFEIQYFF